MANSYNGEIDIALFGKVYPMKINMAVVAEFQSETGADYMHVAISAMNAFNKSLLMDPFERAEQLTQAVPMDQAAWLFYLAAKQMDKTVTFEEIQEAVLNEGPVMIMESGDDAEVRQSYPLLFTNLVMFATLGVVDNAKKPD